MDKEHKKIYTEKYFDLFYKEQTKYSYYKIILSVGIILSIFTLLLNTDYNILIIFPILSLLVAVLNLYAGLKFLDFRIEKIRREYIRLTKVVCDGNNSDLELESRKDCKKHNRLENLYNSTLIISPMFLFIWSLIIKWNFLFEIPSLINNLYSIL